MEKISLDKIVFGKTDAFRELNTFGQDYFVNSFVSNPKYHIDEFFSGDRYYICGKKGTGKSAFLKYLECSFTKNTENLVFSIRFKSDIDQIDKESFEEIAIKSESSLDEEKYEISSITDQASYVLVWKTFLINQIITRASAGEYRVFADNDDYRLLVSLLKCIYGETDTPAIIMPKIKRGSVELTAAFADALSASVKLELDFDSNKKRINYSKISKKVYQLFSQLHFVCSPVYILIDELELSVRNKHQYEKDVALVRDLILAIDDINSMCADKCQNIHIFTTCRLSALGVLKPRRAVAEGGQRHTALPRRRGAADRPGLPAAVGAGVALRQGPGRPSKPDAPGLCGGNALGLPLTDAGPLILRHKGEHLEHDVAEEGAHQVLAPPGVQQGHIQHHDVHPPPLGQKPPLLQNLPVVPPQPVDALDVEQVVRL
jgi:hypothetical protein